MIRLLIIVYTLFFFSFSYCDTLKDAVHGAMENSVYLKSERDSRSISKINRKQGVSLFTPDVYFGVKNNSDTDYSTSYFKASYSHPVGGKKVFEYKKLKHESKIGDFLYAKAEQNVIFDCIDAYFNVLFNQLSLDLLDKKIAIYEIEVKSEESKKKLGGNSTQQLEISKVKHLAALTEKSKVIRSLNMAKNKYKRIVGRDDFDGFMIPDSVPEVTIGLEEAKDITGSNNLNLLVAREKMKISELDSMSVRSSFLPDIYADVMVRNMKPKVDFLEKMSFNLDISIPLFRNGGSNILELRKSRIKNSKLLSEYKENLQIALDDIESEIENFLYFSLEVELKESELKIAKLNFSSIEQEFGIGVKTASDKMSSEVDCLSAEIKLLFAKRDKLLSSYKILSLQGILDLDSII